MLPLLGSGFVPTDSMPGWLQVFAENQPRDHFIEAIRELLLGVSTSSTTVVLAIGWSVVIAVGGYIWSMVIYERKSVR